MQRVCRPTELLNFSPSCQHPHRPARLRAGHTVGASGPHHGCGATQQQLREAGLRGAAGGARLAAAARHVHVHVQKAWAGNQACG